MFMVVMLQFDTSVPEGHGENYNMHPFIQVFDYLKSLYYFYFNLFYFNIFIIIFILYETILKLSIIA